MSDNRMLDQVEKELTKLVPRAATVEHLTRLYELKDTVSDILIPLDVIKFVSHVLSHLFCSDTQVS